MRLLQPQHTMEILDQSSSIVGISVMSSQAAAAGPATFLSFAALISFSLGFMNLLPIPPLDGGKLVIEIIQKIVGREFPLKVQTIVSYVGIRALCAAVCLYASFRHPSIYSVGECWIVFIPSFASRFDAPRACGRRADRWRCAGGGPIHDLHRYR